MGNVLAPYRVSCCVALRLLRKRLGDPQVEGGEGPWRALPPGVKFILLFLYGYFIRRTYFLAGGNWCYDANPWFLAVTSI